jgi:hypothetical protein
MAVELQNLHGVGSLTNFLAGLICMEWLRVKGTPLTLDVAPPWILSAFGLDVIGGKVMPPKRGK